MGANATAEKRILCYGDSNTWGYIPGSEKHRHPSAVRWPGVLAKELGGGYAVLEEGLGGRTTVHDDTVEVPLVINRNGMTTFGAILDSHSPLDFVVIMLGTNDLKQRYHLAASDIALGAANLANVARMPNFGPGLSSPAEVLVVCPPPILEVGEFFGSMFRGGAEKSKALPAAFRMLKGRGRIQAQVLYAGEYIQSDPADGIHLSSESHAALAKAIGQWIMSKH